MKHYWAPELAELRAKDSTKISRSNSRCTNSYYFQPTIQTYSTLSPNNNHYIASPITKYYTKHNSYMIPISTNHTLQNISNPTNPIASKLPSVRNPSPHSIKYSIPCVSSLQQLPTTNRTPNEMNHDNINKNLVSGLKQNNKKYSVSLRKRLSPYNISIDTTHGTNINIPITNYLSDNKLPISISVINSIFSQSDAKKQTNLDNITKNTKIVIDSPAQILQVSRTPTKCSISKTQPIIYYQSLFTSSLRILK